VDPTTRARLLITTRPTNPLADEEATLEYVEAVIASVLDVEQLQWLVVGTTTTGS